MNQHDNWAILRHYDADHLGRIALPLGGIGTGTISLGGRGDFRDCEIQNRPHKGWRGIGLFFCVRCASADGPPMARLLEGPLELYEYEGSSGSPAFNHGLPRFRHCSFEAGYPLGRVALSDPDVPLNVRLDGWNPLIPGDSDRSGLPVAILEYTLTNTGESPLEVALCGTLTNIIADGVEGSCRQNTHRETGPAAGLELSVTNVPEHTETAGSVALVTDAREGPMSHRTAWARRSWGDSLLDFWDDLLEDGSIEERAADGEPRPRTSLCTSRRLAPGRSTTVRFVLGWHFPHRRTWSPGSGDCDCSDGDPDVIGNYYTTRFEDAWHAATHTLQDIDTLRADTQRFLRAFCAADLPAVVKEAALFNLSTLRTQTCFRTPDGRFYGWEGCHDRAGCCPGSCTHVWNYEQATAFLFGDLARTMREVEFGHATDAGGCMSFRVHLPLERARDQGRAAADGQMGCLMKLYRDWQLCGDTAFLRRLWPQARRALEFCWIPGGWDADRDGVMEGCQHNTMDVEYYGPNPQMQGWYLGALRASEEMARACGDTAFADTCRKLFENGRAWTDAHLFNGAYYEHEIRPPASADAVAEPLRVGMGAGDLADPVLQLGAGCLVDQLVGACMARVCGLGDLLDPDHVRTTLRSIMKYNFRRGLHGHFNHMRSYALGDESALLMATYPLGRRPKRPFPYFNEVMTGFEYCAGVHMLYESLMQPGLEVIRAIRERYDGRKRNPFDEAECGHHYARAMASWGAVLSLSGFQYSAVTGIMTFRESIGRHFWSTGSAWGTCEVRRHEAGRAVPALEVLHGTLALRELRLGDATAWHVDTMRKLAAGESLNPGGTEADLDA